ncbi:sirohydrochlorin ferrochelatase [Saccharothrix ecbatanensis]|jgi:sirohydrochlorin ferrochelatase|uniref:Sirohydrochlorin ferrochelatase n=1 Tax=Saccharothrix ecbatanensis TaxID=1105145 RepID=A0A7W9HSU2_9PSEU|nr:sirohydrochlorin chelatase [Saccharothrix ecbatanensis]MBB5807798.1 sirohydrochlorin ferrochelatase [Saccharothrix ecbatanensis]
MTLVLVAHGTRDPAGAVVVEEIASLVSARLGGVPVRVAYADVRQPDVTAVLSSISGPAVVVPAFLAAGYHVRVDIPAQVEASGHPDTVITDPIGPALLPALLARLTEAGWTPGDSVVLAAAGSSDPRALADVRAVATALSHRVGGPVTIGYAATATPHISDVVASASGRVAVASWLLAPGLFHQAVVASGAAVVAAPIGAHLRVVEAVLLRYYEARCFQDVA